MPASVGIADITNWTASNGIGILASNYNETALRGFLRGGCWACGSSAGILSLIMGILPGSAGGFSFRVAVPAS